VDGQSLYLVRTEPGQVNAMMLRAEELLADSNPARIIMSVRSLQETREESYRLDSSMSRILQVVIGTLVFITSMGIVGLAVFGINRRRKQIGTRRALGATQLEIIRYFVTENLIISVVGVTLGALLTTGFNIFLVQAFNMPRIDWYYIPLGMLTLILVGFLAVLGPSRGASRIPPALATRSV
jgi:putative ABC transport system permease protein